MGMPVHLVLYARDPVSATTAATAAFALIAELENTFSDYRADSELRRLETQPDKWVPVSTPLFDVLQRALDIARLTDGAFDPAVGPLVNLWRDARRTGHLPANAALDSARMLTGWRKLELDTATRSVRLARAGMRLDLGGIAKGYILQAALRALAEYDVVAALIEAGGDISAAAPPPDRHGWKIDVRGATPDFTARAASLARAALATSGATFQH